MRARYYDPATGRFESEDSAKDGANWSLYAHGDPVNMVDPDGMSPEDESAAQLGEYLKMMSKAYSTVATGYMVAGAWDMNRGRALTTEGMAENSPAAASAGFFQEAMGGAEMRGGIKTPDSRVTSQLGGKQCARPGRRFLGPEQFLRPDNRGVVVMKSVAVSVISIALVFSVSFLKDCLRPLDLGVARGRLDPYWWFFVASCCCAFGVSVGCGCFLMEHIPGAAVPITPAGVRYLFCLFMGLPFAAMSLMARWRKSTVEPVTSEAFSSEYRAAVKIRRFPPNRRCEEVAFFCGAFAVGILARLLLGGDS